ncbi:MAG TPA: hypothetical protein DCZ80_06615 [Legionellales bacterium]|nr:hypothetical protein [Legionellales bacterium]
MPSNPSDIIKKFNPVFEETILTLAQRLDDSNPLRQELLNTMAENQQLVEDLVKGEFDEQRLQSGKRYLLDAYMNHQILDVLIEQYQNKETVLNPSLRDESERQAILSHLKTLKAKCTQELNKQYGKNLRPDQFKLVGVKPHAYYSNAYGFEHPYAVQAIVGDICKKFREKDQNPPLTFIVNSPSNESTKNQSAEELRKDIANNILTGAAKAGYKPDQITIIIDNTPYPTSRDALGISHFDSWAKTASDKINEFANQDKGAINTRSP